MPRKTIKGLEDEITILKARLAWQENLNRRLLVLLEDARDHFAAISKNIEIMLPGINVARDIYAKVVIDVREATHGQNKDTGG